MRYLSLLLLSNFLPEIDGFSVKVRVQSSRPISFHNRHWMSSAPLSDEDQTQAWRDRAAKLRKEVEEYEKSRPQSSSSSATQQPEKFATYTTVADSVWTVTYRFSDEPPQKDDEKDTRPRQFFSGKVTLRFRSDGYTDLIDQSALKTGTATASIQKAWGWDVETSNEDDNEYLLFSLDVKLPNKQDTKRFYFQGQKQTDPKGVVSLSQGTVTIKQDVVKENTRWGLFAPKGILAQFRYAGDFIAKPTVVED